jgi:hypothetical protein
MSTPRSASRSICSGTDSHGFWYSAMTDPPGKENQPEPLGVRADHDEPTLPQCHSATPRARSTRQTVLDHGTSRLPPAAGAPRPRPLRRSGSGCPPPPRRARAVLGSSLPQVRGQHRRTTASPPAGRQQHAERAPACGQRSSGSPPWWTPAALNSNASSICRGRTSRDACMSEAPQQGVGAAAGPLGTAAGRPAAAVAFTSGWRR